MLKASGFIFLVFFCCLNGFAQELQPEIDTKPTDSGSIREYNRLSKEYLEREPEKALDLSTKAFEAARGLNFKTGMAEALANLGQFYLDQGESSTALEYFTNYKKLSEELKDSLLLADAYMRLGTVHRQQRLLEEALAFYQDAITIAKLRGYNSIIGKGYNKIGGLYYYQQDYTQANRYFFKSLEYISPEIEKAEYAAVLNNIGVVYKAMEKYRQSLAYLKQALELIQRMENVRDVSVVMMNIGEIYQKYNDYDLAESYYTKALEAALQVHAVERIAESYAYLAGLYAEKENYQKAYQYQSIFTAYKDTLARIEQRLSVQEISQKLEVERKEKLFSQLVKDKELELLNQEFKISKLELSRKNSLIYLIGTISLLLSMFALVLYQRNELKKRENQQLEAQHKDTSEHNRQLQEINEKLVQREQQLKSLNETKDKFFSIISHDLRSPLYTLAGFIQIMKKDIGSFSEEELQRFSIQMERSLQGVTALLDNLLQWAAQQTGLIEFAPTGFKLRKVVEESIHLLQATADLKEIELKHEVEDDFRVQADIQMMRLILRNLLANSVKFTERNGEVRVKAKMNAGKAIIIVQDTGIGMTAEACRKLFKEKSIYTRRGTQNEKGSGLGLLLCKEFLELHGGSIEVSSVPGEGSTFSISLPQPLTGSRA